MEERQMQEQSEDVKSQQFDKDMFDNTIEAQSPLMKINADSQEPLQFGCMWAILVLLIIFIFLLALALPDVFDIKTNIDAYKDHVNQCPNPIGFDGNSQIYCQNGSQSNPVYGLILSNTTNLDQFVLYALEVTMLSNKIKDLNITQNITLRLYAIDSFIEGNSIKYGYKDLLDEKVIELSMVGEDKGQDDQDEDNQNNQDDDSQRDSDNGRRDDDRRRLQRRRKNPFWFEVAWKIFAYQKDLTKFDNYFLQFSFQNTSQLQDIRNIRVVGTTVSRQFTVFTIVLRYVYLFISIISCIIYCRRYFQIDESERVLQVKLVALLSLLLIFFNDPLYAVTVLKPNPITTFFSVFFVLDFQIYVYGLYIFLLSRIYYETNLKNTKMTTLKSSWPKFILLFALYVLSMVLFCQYAYQGGAIFISTRQLLKPRFVVPLIMLVVGIIIVSAWIFILYIMVIVKNCQNELLWRQKQTIYLLPFFFIMFTLTFVAEGTRPYEYSLALWVLYGYSFQMIFALFLQYLYYTPASALEQKNQSNQIQMISSTQDFEIVSYEG